MLNRILSNLLLLGIKLYKNFISPILPGSCRYYPTCSEYGIQAITWHGSIKGSLLTIKRISRCHPLGGHGIDFVPLPLDRYTYKPMARAINQTKTFVSRETILIDRGVFKDTTSYLARLNYLILSSPIKD